MKAIPTVIVSFILGFQLSAQVSFNLSSSPTADAGPVTVAAADVNGDGKVDLISANVNANTLSVLTNNGSGGFVTSGSYPVGSFSRCVVASDINGDGKVDLISANSSENTLSVLTNNGSGGFATSDTHPVGGGPVIVTAADVNGDGKADLICANFYDNSLSVLTNNGRGGIALASSPGVGNAPYGVTAADVNGDGKADLICANFYDNSLSVLTNDGSGGFVTSGTLGVGGNPASVVAADVNGDGKVDLVSANSGDNTLSMLTNNGTGGFVLASSPGVGSVPIWVAAVDVNGDGEVDLISANYESSTLSVLTNNGSGGFALATSPSVGNGPYGVTAADVNRDGKLDLISANLNANTLSVLTNATPFPPLSPPVITGFSPTAATIGTNVTLSGNHFSSVASNNIVYFGAVRAIVTAASSTSLTVTVPAGATYAPITETVNGLTAYSSQLFLPTFPGGGPINSSSLTLAATLPTVNGPTEAVIRDLDGDGRPDLVISDAYSADILIYQNISSNGTLAFGPWVKLPMVKGENPVSLVVADLDGDGKPDILVLNNGSKLISVLRNISSPGILTTNSFAPRIDISNNNDMQSLAVADLNGDGKPDIITANGASNSVSILQNQSTIGNISLTAPINFAVANYASDVAIADLDGDGNPDFAVLIMNNGTVSVFRNLGLGGTLTTNSFASQVVFPGGAPDRHICIGDMDGDGKLDIATADWTSDQISVLRNTTSGPGITSSSFAPTVNFGTGGWANNLTLGDLNGDGKLDIVVASQLPSLFSVFQNTSTPGSFTTGSLAARVDLTSGYNPDGPAIGDLNGDGKPDLVLPNTYSSNIFIFANSVPISLLPQITGQPQDAYVYAFGTASFSVTATGASSYHWLFNGSNLLNATASTLLVPDANPANLGPYSAIVANNYGSVTSSIANLYMYPSIVTPFTGVVTDWGQNTILSVGAWGSGTLTYQWYDNGNLIPNATNSTLNFAAIQFTNAGSYSVVVSSSLGSVTNTAAQVVVNPAGVSLGLYPGITITGTVGYTYNIQSNPDLTNPNGWTTVATVTLWQPTQFWVDVNSNAASPTNQHRYYRILPAQ